MRIKTVVETTCYQTVELHGHGRTVGQIIDDHLGDALSRREAGEKEDEKILCISIDVEEFISEALNPNKGA